MNNNQNNNDKNALEQLLIMLHAEAATAMYDNELETTSEYRRKTDIYTVLSIAEATGPGAASVIAKSIVKASGDDHIVMADLLMALVYKCKFYEQASKEDQSPVFKILATEYSVAMDAVHEHVTKAFADNDEALDYITSIIYE